VKAQQEKTQAEILNDINFDQVVLTTLIALEQNYQVKERLLPLVHQNDYFTVILNTAKRISLNSASQKKISTVIPAKQDSSDAKK